MPSSALLAYLEKRHIKGERALPGREGADARETISVRGIQKRIEYYCANKRIERVVSFASDIPSRHSFLNADRPSCLHPDLLGQCHITTTQRYCRVANLKVPARDYYKAMEVVLQRMQALEEDEPDPRSTLVNTEPMDSTLREVAEAVVRKAPRPSSFMEREKKWRKSENGEKGMLHEKQKEQRGNWTQ